VILTGANGFIGREVARQLVRHGHGVHAIGRRPPDDAAISHQSVDLLRTIPDLASIGATHLVHCAWYAEPGRFWDAAENCDWVAGSLRLARAFVAAGGQRMVVAGSCAEYGWDRPVFEEDNLGPPPQSLYGQAKRSLFEILSAAAPVLKLSMGWGRIFIPYGAREDSRRLLGTLIAAKAAGRDADFSPGEQVRDFVHVEDVAGALVALLESTFEGPVNIGSGVGTSVRTFIEEAAAAADYAGHIRLGARAIRPGEPASLIADTMRLTEIVGFRPRFSLSTGLAEALGG
jgi:nucleoside-diphosphate-sugar epimerase